VNKSDLVAKLTARLDGDRRMAAAAVNGVLEEIEQSLVRGERVSLFGFGTFDRRERGPRTARNPATGETIQVGASVAPVFRAGAGLKQMLAEAAGTARGTARTAGGQVASAAQEVPAAAVAVTAPATKATKKAAKKAMKKATSKGSNDSPKASGKATSKTAKSDTGKAANKNRGKGAKKG
jgi:DNA-binding protein HU-beta